MSTAAAVPSDVTKLSAISESHDSQSRGTGGPPPNAAEKRKSIWTRKKVYELIALYQANDCLWNCSQRNYKDRDKRVEVVRKICATMGITKDQFARKIHNLRNQFIFEMRKLQKMRSFDESSDECTSKWEYFDQLQFLRKYITTRPSFGENEQKLQISEDESTVGLKGKEAADSLTKCARTAEEAQENQPNFTCNVETPVIFEMPRVLDLNSEHEPATEAFQEPEKPPPPKKPTVELGGGKDDSEVFGQFVAMELRSLSSEASRKRLKRKIMQAILDVGNDDDGININIKLT